VVLAFPHQGGLRGMAIPDVETISTPLGEVPIDREFAQGFARVAEDQVCDHSFEIQLPFLQRAVPNARVTPVYVGRTSAGERRAAAERLAAAWQPGVVFLASSDFTHYGRGFGYVPFPADSTVATSYPYYPVWAYGVAGFGRQSNHPRPGAIRLYQPVGRGTVHIRTRRY